VQRKTQNIATEVVTSWHSVSVPPLLVLHLVKKFLDDEHIQLLSQLTLHQTVYKVDLKLAAGVQELQKF
jgi:hypothetical protein